MLLHEHETQSADIERGGLVVQPLVLAGDAAVAGLGVAYALVHMLAAMLPRLAEALVNAG